MERNGKGRITIEFSNNDQFESIVGKLKALTGSMIHKKRCKIVLFAMLHQSV